jgi:hypothetical protein
MKIFLFICPKHAGLFRMLWIKVVGCSSTVSWAFRGVRRLLRHIVSTTACVLAYIHNEFDLRSDEDQTYNCLCCHTTNSGTYEYSNHLSSVYNTNSGRPDVYPNYGFLSQLEDFALCAYEPSLSNPVYISWKRTQKQNINSFLGCLDDTVTVLPDHLLVSRRVNLLNHIPRITHILLSQRLP